MQTYKARKLQTDEANKILEELIFCENPKQRDWILNCESNRDFYYGEQISEAEKEILEARGYYDIVINKIRKSIRGLVGLLSGALPKFGALSYGKEDSTKTDIINHFLDYSWKNSGGLAHYKSWLKKAAINNISYQHTVFLGKERKIKEVMLSYDEVIVSPNSRDRMFRDAYIVGVKKYVPIQHIEALYGIEKLTTIIPEAMYSSWERDRDLDPETRKERKLFLDKMYSGDKQYVLVYEIYRKVYRVNTNGVTVVRIKRQTVLGHEHVYEEWLPENVKEYPIVPLYVEDTENPYKIGEVHFLRELQRFINKVFGVVIANAQMMSNPKLFLEENSILGDKDEFIDNYAQPGSISLYRQGAQPPVIIEGQPLNQAFYGLYLEAKNEMEWATVPDDMLGYGDRGKKEEYKSYLLEKREAVIESFSDFMSTIDSAMVQLARTVVECIRANFTLEEQLKICDKEELYPKYMEFKELGLDLENPESIDQYIAQMQQQGADEETIANILDEANHAFGFYRAFNEVQQMDMSEDNDIYIVAGSYSSTRGVAMLRLMMELQQIGAVSPSSVLEYAPVDNKDKLLKRYDELQQARGMIDDMQAKLEHYESLITKQDRKLAENEAEKYVIMRKAAQSYQENMVKLKAYLHKHTDKLQTKEKMIELNRIIKELEDAVKEMESMKTEVEREPERLSPII